MQLCLKALLDPQLSNVFGAAVIGRIVRFVQLFLLRHIDAPDVANHVAGELAKRVIAKQPGLDVHARKAVALCRKTGHFFVGQAAAQGQGLKTFAFFTQLLETTAVTRGDFQHVRQFVNGLLQIGHPGRRDFECVG